MTMYIHSHLRRVVDAVTLDVGQRRDVILTADQAIGNFWIRASKGALIGQAILRYQVSIPFYGLYPIEIFLRWTNRIDILLPITYYGILSQLGSCCR